MGQLRRRHRMWRTLHELIAGSEEATGRLKIETIKTKDGPVRCLRLLGRKDIAEKLIGLPIIVADATLPLEIVKHFLPSVDLVRDINVEAPHMKITQVIGLPVGKMSLQALAPSKRKPEEEARVARKRQSVADACRHRVKGRRGLVNTYQSIESDFAGIENVETAHWRHRRHRSLGKCRRDGDDRPAVPEIGRHPGHGGRHYGQTGYCRRPVGAGRHGAVRRA
jgi:hypothetical protein